MEKIQIGETDSCPICHKFFKYRFTKWRLWDTPEGLWEVKMKFTHPECSNLMNRRDKLINELETVETELFWTKHLG